MQVILCEKNHAVLVSHREGLHLVLNVTFTGLERYMCKETSLSLCGEPQQSTPARSASGSKLAEPHGFGCSDHISCSRCAEPREGSGVGSGWCCIPWGLALGDD